MIDLHEYRSRENALRKKIGIKKEPEKMIFIASTKFPPYDLCLHSSCDNCAFSEYHTGYNPRIMRRI